MNSDILISEETYEDLFKSFRKQKLIVARPSSISIIKKEDYWMITLSLNPGTYRRASTYMTYKPLFAFIKNQIISQTKIDKVSIQWEIVRN